MGREVSGAQQRERENTKEKRRGVKLLERSAEINQTVSAKKRQLTINPTLQPKI
jgi:hypothetical protein